MNAFTSFAAAPIAAAIGGLVTYFVARRRFSGQIDTSDASELWNESTRIRQELRDEVASLRTQARLDRIDCERQLADLKHQIETLRKRLEIAGQP